MLPKSLRVFGCCGVVTCAAGVFASGGEWTAVAGTPVSGLSSEVIVGNVETQRPARPRAIPSPQVGRGPILLAAGAPDPALDERLEPTGSGLTRPPRDFSPDTPARPVTTPRIVRETVVPEKVPHLAPPQSGRTTTLPVEAESPTSKWLPAGSSIVNDVADETENAQWENVASYYPSELCEDEIIADGWCDGFMPCEMSCGPEGSIWDMGFSRLGNLSINVGVTGFQGAIDFGQNSNFGFAEGFNWSMPITPQQFISGQVGYRATQTNLTGTAFGSGSRNQHAITAGVFLRNHFSRFQAGIVYDWMQEDFYSHIRMEQLRMELSVRTLGQYEFGFLGAKAMSSGNNVMLPFAPEAPEIEFKPLDYYTLFIRKNMVCGGIGTLSGGTTNLGGGIFGAKYEIPISDRFYINSQVLMYIPKEGRGIGGQAKESWGVGIDLVWTLGRGAMSRQCNMSRPMFDVVDSTTLIPSIR
ncbi:MAG: DUF6666 family protein [Thermoguttaceae bacterium]